MSAGATPSFVRAGLLARLDEIDSACGEGFPLHSLDAGHTWTLSRGGSWSGGFWAACFWLRAALTGSAADHAKAAALCGRLTSRLSLPTGHRAFLFWFGAALGARWCGDASARALADQAAAALCQDFSEALQAIPLGTALGGGPQGSQRVSIDALAPTLLLLTQHGDTRAQDVARRHADTLLLACGTADGGFHAEAQWHGSRWEGLGEAGDWSRGQAWAMLGTCTAAALWGGPHTAVAVKTAAHWLRTRPAFPPAARLQQPQPDPSAAVIAAHALWTLAELQNDDAWAREADQLLGALLASPWLATTPTLTFLGCDLSPASPTAKPQLAETVWGTFMVLAALDRSHPTLTP